jgi:SPP1 gp7 family putative phage head morphogenesis protein
MAEGRSAYREAIATQVEGNPDRKAWDDWQQVTAALLLVSWASGAVSTINAAGLPSKAIQIPVVRFALNETRRVKVGSASEEISMRFDAGPAREVVERYIRMIPITRQQWESLIDHAILAAGEIRETEQASALDRILDRSPELADIIRTRRNPKVQSVVQGSFFVTGMDQDQIEKTQALLARVIRQEITTSVAGKKLAKLGIGDFVEQTVLSTGTDLTNARLETVYRTNLNRAQSQGQLDICRDTTVKAFVPLMQFSATKDNRTRDTHREMHGFVATVDQIDAMGIPTPIGFNCRCSWNPVPIAVAVSKGWCDEDGNPLYKSIRTHNGSRQGLIDKGLVPDRGFISG